MVEEVTKLLPVIFPIHPRTENKLKNNNLWKKTQGIENLAIIPAQGYINFMSLISNAKLVISDSGGIQSETTYLNIPCITVRDSTEKPQTISKGTNVLSKTKEVPRYVQKILSGKWKTKQEIEGWDGKTAERVCTTLKNFLNSK